MKKAKTPRLVTISVTTTITIIFWVFFGLYTILVTPTKIDIEQKLLEPLNPILDTDVLQSLKDRVFFEQEDVASTPPQFDILVTTPVVEESEESSDVPSLTPSPEVEKATVSGQLE